jgi:2-hydroxy-3-keto-5-methylthiopentenyl-1-phosphate phosphatase
MCMRLRIFCDFDGTIAVNDVGNELFTRFGDAQQWWRLVASWRQGAIDGRQLWQEQCSISCITPAQLDAFAAAQSIDPGFAAFHRFCQQQALALYVVSDGMDAYIERILRQHRIDKVHLRCNHLLVDDNGRLEVSFPYYGQSCGRCANCKGSHLRTEKQAGEKTIFIGDGLSDLCAVGEADILFAKKDLARYCQQHGQPFVEYADFFNVREEIEAILLNT